MDLSVYDTQYDTDNVSITSTAASEGGEDKIYDVETILCEDPHWERDDGTSEIRYLIKWANYPPHQCSWEPIECIEDDGLLRAWQAKRSRMSDAEFLDYQTKIDDQHQDAVNFADVLRERRLAKRTEKRKKIAKLGRKSALFIAEKQKRAPPARAKDQSSSESSDEVDDNSDDSLLEEVANNPKRRVPPEPKPPQKAQAEQANQPARSARQTSSEKAPTTLPSRKPVERRTSIASPSTEPVPRNTIAAAVRRKSTSFEATSPSFRTTAALPSAAASSKPTEKGYKTPATAKSANPIRMLMDKPKEPARKAWNTTDKHFTTLHFRANAMKRGRIEGTPDPSSLEFVNGKPDGLVTKPSEAGALHRVDETDANPENRRETGRRTLLNRNDDLEDEPEPISALQPFERSKIPEICFDWHNGHCNFPAEKCRRLHRRTDGTGKPLRLGHWNGAITPKYATPPQTCWWWLRGEKGCSKSAEDCIYAHENTGWLIQLPGGKVVKIDPSERPGATNLNATISAYSGFVLPKNAAEPVTCHYWFLTRKGCSKSAEECKYAHVNTGLLGNSEGRLFDRIDRSLAPVFMRNQNHPTVPIGPARVPDKEKTCFFWNEYKCKKGEACFYKHEYTGIVAEPPPNFTYQGKPRTGLLRGKPSCEHSETELDMQLTLHNETLIRSNVYHIPFQEVAKDQPNAMSPPLSNDESTAELLSCTDFKNDIEDACKLNFTEIFSLNFDDMSETISDRRAFLLFHPEHHMEELELITRWLLMHHVDVYNFWYDDAWEQFQEQIAQGGTGAIMAHPDFECWSDVPGLGEILKAKVRLWSVGFQKESAFDPQISTFAPTMQYECIEIFPHGGIIYITDDVFRKKPAEALKIFELFLAKIEKCRQVAGPIDPFKRVDDGCLLWRIGVRPELMQALYERVERHEADIEEGNPQFVSLLKLYELFEETKYIERDIVGPLTLQPDDYFPIISERHSTMEDYYYPALATSQSLANTKMIEYFSGMLIDQRQYYRQFFVIHTEPDGNDAKEWKEKVQNIDEVMSAEQFIDEFEKEPRGNRFDFYEWAFPPKPRADSVADAMVTT